MIRYEDMFKVGLYSGHANLDWNIKKGEKVVDIGGGSNPFRYATHVIDLADEKYESQRHGRKIVEMGDIEFINSPAEEIFPELPDNFFDFIYCSHTLEHFEDVPFMLDELGRVGKRGYIAVPTAEYDVIDTSKENGHKWLFNMDYKNRTLLYRERYPHEFYFNHGTNVLMGPLQGHNPVDYHIRAIWEIRFFWEDSIEYAYSSEICANTKHILEKISVKGEK